MPTETTVKEMDVVLNGGHEIMESATIPFRWFFSDEVIEEQPTHIFVVDLTQYETEHRPEISGERSVSVVSRGSDFIQFHSPGRHTLVFTAMKFSNKEDASVCIANFLKLNQWGRYYEPTYPKEMKYLHGAVASIVVEVDVPEEFFEKRPESGVGKLIWQWVNLWHAAPPRDQCEFRHRMFWAFTAQPILVGTGKLLQFGVYAPIVSFVAIFCRLAVLFCGYRPAPIFSDLNEVWQWKFNGDPCFYVRKNDHNYGYAVWRPFYEPGGEKYMPVTGLEILVGSIVLFIGYLTLHAVSWNDRIFLGVVAVLLLGFLVAVVKKRTEKAAWFKKCKVWLSSLTSLTQKLGWKRRMQGMATKRAEECVRVAEVRAERPSLFFEWLKLEAHISKKPARVDVKTLPRAFKSPSVQRFRVAFWDIKGRICRPYAK